MGFQFFYVLSNAFKSRGSDVNLDSIDETELYLPDAKPVGAEARNRFLNYRRDSDIPKHRFHWNCRAPETASPAHSIRRTRRVNRN